MRRGFTGRHMAASMVGFFTVVIAVNVTMATVASHSFGGTVVDNSYVASQHYNEWLARATAQDRLGWERSVTIDPDRRIRLKIRKDGAILNGLRVRATLSHPLGRVEPRPLHFLAARDGSLLSVETLPAGRWRIDLTVRRGADEGRYREDLQ